MNTLIFSQDNYFFHAYDTGIEVIDNQEDYVAAWISLSNIKILIEYLQANSKIYKFTESFSENEIFLDGYSYSSHTEIIEIYDSEEHHAYYISKSDIDRVIDFLNINYFNGK